MLRDKIKGAFKLDFTNLNIKLKRSILVILILLAIAGCSVYFIKLKNTEEYLTYTYLRQIETFLPDTTKSVVKVEKVSEDLQDYIVVLSDIEYINKYTEGDINNIVSNVKSYSNIEILYVNKIKEKVISLTTDISFPTSINLQIANINNNRYAVVNSLDSDSIIITRLNDEKLENLITKNFRNKFTGYSISTKFNTENSNILKVNLDYDKNEHLREVTTEYSLDFSKISEELKNYRKSYLNNNYNYTTLEDIDNDNVLELVGYQNLLYNSSSSETSKSVLGKVITYFCISEDKISYKNVEVKE